MPLSTDSAAAAIKSYLLDNMLSPPRHTSYPVAASSNLLAKEVRRLFAASDRSYLGCNLGLADAFGRGSERKTNIFMVQVVDGRWAWRDGVRI